MLSDGAFVIIWLEMGCDGDGYGIFGRVFSSAGTPLSNDFQVNTTSESWQNEPAIASSPGGHVVVVWLSYESGNIFARLLASKP